MATLPLNPANPNGAQVVDNMALQAPAYNGQPSSLVGTMVGPTLPKAVVQPAVVTSSVARKQTIANTQQLDNIQAQLNQAMATAKELKAQEEAAKAEAAKNNTSATDKAINNMAGVQPNQPSQAQIEAQNALAGSVNELEALRVRMDANSSASIQAIQDEYAALARQQEQLNKQYEAGTVTEGFRSDRARYAPLLQAQIIKGATDAGIQKLSDLNVKKNRLILEAQTARDEKSFKVLQEKMSTYREIVKEERATAQQTYENAIKASQEARAQLKAEQEADKYTWDYASTIAPSVADEASQIKDPAQQAAYIQNVATQIGIDPGILFGEVQKYTDTTAAKNSTGVKEYQYAVDQGFKGTLLQYKQSIAAATRAPQAPRAVNTLTAYEAANLGLPKTMVGMSEAVVQEQLNSPNIAVWFKQMNPGATQEMWDSFRLKVPSSGNTIETPTFTDNK